jgi:hypothetical protein
VWTRIIQVSIYEFVLIYDRRTHRKTSEVSKKGFPLEPRYAWMCTFSTKKLRHWHMRFKPPACTILFLYQNHQDTPSEIQNIRIHFHDYGHRTKWPSTLYKILAIDSQERLILFHIPISIRQTMEKTLVRKRGSPLYPGMWECAG